MKITRLAILITLTFSVLKSQATEFNASLLDSGNLSNVDLTAFSREGMWRPVTIFSISGSMTSRYGNSIRSELYRLPDATRPSSV